MQRSSSTESCRTPPPPRCGRSTRSKPSTSSTRAGSTRPGDTRRRGQAKRAISAIAITATSATPRLSLGHLSATSRPPLGHLSATARPPLGCLSATARLPLGHLSATARLPLGCRSATARRSLGCTWPICRLSLVYLSAASRPGETRASAEAAALAQSDLVAFASEMVEYRGLHGSYAGRYADRHSRRGRRRGAPPEQVACNLPKAKQHRSCSTEAAAPCLTSAGCLRPRRGGAAPAERVTHCGRPHARGQRAGAVRRETAGARLDALAQAQRLHLDCISGSTSGFSSALLGFSSGSTLARHLPPLAAFGRTATTTATSRWSARSLRVGGARRGEAPRSRVEIA